MTIHVRAAKVDDIDSIFNLINQMADKGLMLKRSKYKIVTMLTNYLVAETDEIQFIGCGALLPLWTDSAEIMSLAVKTEFHGMGIGRHLVSALVERARALGFPEVISLTYQTEFFSKMGFKKGSRDEYPRKLWRECLECPKLENCDEVAMSLRF